jgi:ABC-type nickel/cobalt efflux system permease component RcnA
LYPWLGVASGALIVAMGLLRLFGQLRSSGFVGDGLGWLRARVAGTLGRRALALGSGESGAVVLAPAAAQAHGGRLDHTHDDGHSHHDDGTHRHGSGLAHSHKIPGQDGEPVTWRQLIGLGIFGGMLPCPSAIVAMLSAISLHRVGFGLVLIVAFSPGLAGVLTGIGFALVFARGLSARLVPAAIRSTSARRAGRVTRVLVRTFPSASAGAVVVAGAVILLRGLAQQGFV